MAIKMSVELPRRRMAPQLARRALEVFSGDVHPSRFYDARLLVTELVGSAVASGGTAVVRVEAQLDAERFRVDVIDLGAGFVGETKGLAALNEAGWDLHLVAELSDRWGTHHRQGIWFEMDLSREAPKVEEFLRPRGAAG